MVTDHPSRRRLTLFPQEYTTNTQQHTPKHPMNRIPPADHTPAIDPSLAESSLDPALPTPSAPTPADSTAHLPPSRPPSSVPLAEVEAAPLPRWLVEASIDGMMKATIGYSSILRDRMQALQIQPRPFSFEEPNVSVFSTDKKSQTCPDCTIATMMVAASHSAALDLHNLACTVTPVPPLTNASERFGVAFFAQTRESAGAAIRLRDTLDIVAAEMATRSLAYVPERPWIEFVHQMLNPIESPSEPYNLLPIEVFRIRFRGLDWSVVEGLLADALSTLPVLTEHNGRSDVFTLTLSGQS